MRSTAATLETARFLVEPIRPARFALQTFHWTGQAIAFANLGWPTSGWTRLRWWSHLRHHNRRGRIIHAIRLRGGPCVGIHLLAISPNALAATLGVFIADEAWRGRGVVAEIRAAIFADCFERLGLERLWTQVHAGNTPAVRNQYKLGMTHEGTLRSTGIGASGTRTDTLIFSLLRPEWRERQRAS